MRQLFENFLDTPRFFMLIGIRTQAQGIRRVNAAPGQARHTNKHEESTMKVYVLEVEVLEAKIAPGGGISLGGQ